MAKKAAAKATKSEHMMPEQAKNMGMPKAMPVMGGPMPPAGMRPGKPMMPGKDMAMEGAGNARLVSNLKRAEAKQEQSGGPKTAKERGLEKAVSKLTGRSFKGKR